MASLHCYFSGVESQQHWDNCVNVGVQNVLMSYWQFFKQRPMLVRDRKKSYPAARFMVDSGAHTFITDWTKFKSWSRKDFDDYVEGYYKWILANRQYVHAVVETDLDYCLNMVLAGSEKSDLGPTIVASWQNRFFRPLEDLGINVIYVWHRERKIEGWEDMCARHAYVGLPGEMSSETDFNRFMSIARRYTTRVHGFAASATFITKVWIQEPDGFVEPVPIGELFERFPVTNKNSVDETVTLPKGYAAWTLTDDLKSEFRPVKSVIKHILDKPIYRVTLRNGKSIEVTHDHSLFTLDKLGNLIESKPKDVRVGEHLVCSQGMPVGTKDVMDVEDAEFIGVWFGDGYISTRGHIYCSKQHQPEILAVCQRFAENRNVVWNLNPDTQGVGIDGNCVGGLAAEWIVLNFGRTGSEKFIGRILYSSKPEIVAAFLRGYFSAGGTAGGKNRIISLSCSERHILEDVQILLEQFNIRSSVRDGGIPQKSDRTNWKLDICDTESLHNFNEKIGFLQKFQNRKAKTKTGAFGVPGRFRGLPVSLLRSSRVYRRSSTHKGGFHDYRPSANPTARASLYPNNFCEKLRKMEAGYVEIVAIEKISDGGEPVYDLCVPDTERFFANGILAHNTKQKDFRDVNWASIDSITWKSGEMWGTCIVWDEAAQKLTFAEKHERANYRGIMEARGFNSDAIIRDTNYKEVTRFCLDSMRRMEKFYADRYAERLDYHSLRLPVPKVVQAISDGRLQKIWKLFRPEELFRKHVNPKPDELRTALLAISAVQNGDYPTLQANPDTIDFLKIYFPALADPLPQDTRIFQREMSAFISPRNPPATQRTSMDHYREENNPSKTRIQKDYDEVIAKALGPRPSDTVPIEFLASLGLL